MGLSESVENCTNLLLHAEFSNTMFCGVHGFVQSSCAYVKDVYQAHYNDTEVSTHPEDPKF